MRAVKRGFRRARPAARWTAADLAEVVEAVLRTSPGVLWSADDLRDRLAFGHEGGGPAASSVREALRELERAGRVERAEVWGRVGWGNTRHGYRAAGAGAQGRLPIAA
jgi:hypothetical protein